MSAIIVVVIGLIVGVIGLQIINSTLTTANFSGLTETVTDNILSKNKQKTKSVLSGEPIWEVVSRFIWRRLAHFSDRLGCYKNVILVR